MRPTRQTRRPLTWVRQSRGGCCFLFLGGRSRAGDACLQQKRLAVPAAAPAGCCRLHLNALICHAAEWLVKTIRHKDLRVEGLDQLLDGWDGKQSGVEISGAYPAAAQPQNQAQVAHAIQLQGNPAPESWRRPTNLCCRHLPTLQPGGAVMLLRS